MHDRAKPMPAAAIPFLLHHIRRHLSLAICLMAAVTAGALLAVAAQYGLKLLVDTMTAPAKSHERDRVFVVLGVFLALLAVESCFWRLSGWLGSRVIIRVGEDIRLDLFDAVASRSWQFFSEQASGALVERIGVAASSATAVLRTIAWYLLPPLTDLIGSVVVLATIDWRIGIGLVFAAGAGTWVLHWAGGRGFPLHRAHHHQAADVAGGLADVLANIAIVRGYGGRAYERARLAALMRGEGRAHAASWMFLERLRCGHDAAFWITTAVVLTASVWQWRRGAISTGSVVVASTLALRILVGSRELALSLLGLAQQLGAVSEAVDTLGEPCAEVPEPGLPALHVRGTGGAAIELRGVCHAPDRDAAHWLFRDLDLHVPPGQRLGVVGTSGAGKSTLLRLVAGVVAPEGGTVLLDGQALSAHEPGSVARAFSVVSQEVALFHRSVADNLLYGRTGVDRVEMEAISRAVGCHGFIEALPWGYDTIVGERGIRLSGGQRQRVAIARALLRQAPVLLLDEATSALDSASESQVLRALLAVAGGRTVLAVAHRLSTLAAFDRVIVLENGWIVEDGSPEELRRANGHFAMTWRLQERAMKEDASL